MGIRFFCPQGHKLNVKEFQAGKKAICPYCGLKIIVPTESTRPSSKRQKGRPQDIASSQAAPPSPGTLPLASVSDSEHADVAVHEPPRVESAGGGSSPSVVMKTAPGDLTRDDSATPGGANEATKRLVEMDMRSAEMDDPLTEDAEVVWYVRPASGGQFGPATNEVMRVWLDEGRIGSDSLIWREGWRDWQEARTVFPQLSPYYASPGLETLFSEEPAKPAAQPQVTHPGFYERHKQALIITLVVMGVVALLTGFIALLVYNS